MRIPSLKYLFTRFGLAGFALVALTGCPDNPPVIESINLEPADVCPGSSVLLQVVVRDGQGWTARYVERTDSAERTISRADVTSSTESVSVRSVVCAPSEVCLVLERDGRSMERCVTVPVRDPDWIEEITFSPDCPDNPERYLPVQIDVEGEGGARVVELAVNRSARRVTVIHSSPGLPDVTETAEAGASYLTLADRPMHRTWAIEASPPIAPGILQCPPPDAETGTDPPDGVQYPEPITITVAPRCGSGSPTCPMR